MLSSNRNWCIVKKKRYLCLCNIFHYIMRNQILRGSAKTLFVDTRGSLNKLDWIFYDQVGKKMFSLITTDHSEANLVTNVEKISMKGWKLYDKVFQIWSYNRYFCGRFFTFVVLISFKELWIENKITTKTQ